MQQTLLVVAATMVLALFGLNRQRAAAADERADVGQEIEVAALGVGERWTGIARDLAFDEADIGAVQMRLSGTVTGLTAVSLLGRDSGESFADLTTLDDIDDLSGLSVTEDAPVASGAVAFRVTATAAYAVPGTWAVSTAADPRTTAKILTVVVTEVTSGATGRPAVRVTLPVRVSPALQFTRTR